MKGREGDGSSAVAYPGAGVRSPPASSLVPRRWLPYSLCLIFGAESHSLAFVSSPPSSSSFHCSVRLGRRRRRRGVRFSRIRVHASSFWTLERFLPHVFADERGEQRPNERTNGAVFWGMAERRHLLPASLQAPGFASKQPIPYIEWEAVGWNAGGQISAVLEKNERMTQGMCEKSDSWTDASAE